MPRWVIPALIVALALPLALQRGAAAAVPCDTSRGEPMPCCERAVAGCDVAGVSADCCVLVPADSLPPALTASPALDAGVLRGHLAVLPTVALALATRELEAASMRRPARARAPDAGAPFFARTTALRI